MIDGMPDTIRLARSDADFEGFARLVEEYVDWCRERYADDVWFVDRVFGHQSLATELKALASAYSPPNGQTLIALRGNEIVGAGAYRRLADGTCEMKRLFVPDRFKGHGTGRRLVNAIVEAAAEEGYGLMRLDTADRLAEATALYESTGFVRCAPHLDYPPELRPYLVFMEKRLAA